MEDKQVGSNRFAVAKRIAVIGILANIFLLAIKLIIGYSTGSQAMIADGFNSAGDVFASLVTLIASFYAARPRDEKHTWGHRKAEYIASMIIAFSMMIVAFTTFTNSLTSLLEGESATFSYSLVIAAGATIVIKGILYIYCTKKGKSLNSLIILSNAVDHRNDVFVTLGTLASILLSLVGITFADGVAGCAIALVIAWTGIKIMMSASSELMDASLPSEITKEFEKQIMDIGEINHVDSIRSKPVGGGQYLIIAKVSVDRNMTVLKSHQIAKQIELRLMENEDVYSAVVHINPDTAHNLDHTHKHE